MVKCSGEGCSTARQCSSMGCWVVSLIMHSLWIDGAKVIFFGGILQGLQITDYNYFALSPDKGKIVVINMPIYIHTRSNCASFL